MAKEGQKEKKETKTDGVVRSYAISALVRFEFDLPADLPKENREAYAKERLKNLVIKLGSLKGLSVSYTVQ